MIAGLVLSGPATAQREGPARPEGGGSTVAGQALAVRSDDSGIMVAAQTLVGIVTRAGVGPLVDAGEARRFATGSNAIGDSAFATFAGILTQSWNTGVNANTQAATNVAWSGRIGAGDAAPPPSEGPR